jgi:hypothetical protein
MPSLIETLAPGKIYVILEAPGWSDRMVEPVLGQGGRCVRKIGGKILPAHIYHNEEERWRGLLSGLVLLRLVTPPLQAGVVGPYLVQGVWFLSHLLLEGTGRIQNFGP